MLLQCCCLDWGCLRWAAEWGYRRHWLKMGWALTMYRLQEAAVEGAMSSAADFTMSSRAKKWRVSNHTYAPLRGRLHAEFTSDMHACRECSTSITQR